MRLLRRIGEDVTETLRLEFESVVATEGLKDDGYSLDMTGADISRFRDGEAP